MSPFLHYTLLSLVLALPSLVRAQAAPPPSGAAAHTHAPVTLDQFITTASPFQRNQVDLAQSTTVLGGRTLLMKRQPTLGETLSAETGVHATSFGPGASRPIIRGLGGDRLRLLENGAGTLDASVASPDHAVSVEPFLVERIEAVRGPASLLYGSSAVGGVVNVITHRIETELPEARWRGVAEVRFDGASDGLARGGMLDLVPLSARDHALVLHLDGFRRSARDVRIPGFAESARVRAEEEAEALAHGEPPPRFARHRLPNSSLDSEGGAIGLSLVGRTHHLGASLGAFDSDYGVPGHGHAGEAGVRIRLRQRRTDLQGEWRGAPGAAFGGARFKFGHANYRHTEHEPDGAIGTVFANKGHDLRADIMHGGGPGWTGSLGAQATRSDFAAEGGEAFLPSSLTRGMALFAFEEVVHGPHTWQFGLRAERTRLDTRDTRRHDDRGLSSSLGHVWKLDDFWSLTFSLARTRRAPNAQELYADGPHAGTQAYEIGDSSLAPEKSLGLEAGLRRRAGRVTGALTLFAHRFDGYIFEQPTGDVMAVGEDGDLPVYRYTQGAARFHGVEVEALWHLHEAHGSQFDLRLAADRALGRESGRNLPRMPPDRLSLGLLWAGEKWSVGIDGQRVFSQHRLAANETPGDDHLLVSAHLSRAVVAGGMRAELFLRGSNLTDAEVRPHTSFLKELAPLPGRAFSAGLRLTF